MFSEFKQGHNIAEETENIYGVKGEGAVDYRNQMGQEI